MSSRTETSATEYYACANEDNDQHAGWCERVIPADDYRAKRSYLISTLAWDLGRQRPECDSCQEAYADIYYA